MSGHMRMTLLLALLLLSGCSRPPAPPTLRPIAKISAKVHEVMELNVEAIANVNVPEAEVLAFAKLITPTEPCIQNIRHDMHYHVADIFVEKPDGSTTTLIVRWTGHNPAAISLDDRNYYYAGIDERCDVAIKIVRLLSEYHYQSRK